MTGATRAQSATHQNEALLFFTVLQLVIIVIMGRVGGYRVAVWFVLNCVPMSGRWIAGRCGAIIWRRVGPACTIKNRK